MHSRGASSKGISQESPGELDGSSLPREGLGRASRVYQRRTALARPSRASLTPWRAAYADALSDLGWHGAASDVRGCGTQSFVSECLACGEKAAAVRVAIHCSVRGCPLCARRNASARVRLVTGAAMRCGDAVRLRSGEVVGKLAAARDAARDAVKLWLGRAARAEERGEDGLAARHRERAERAEERRRASSWARSRAGEWASWRWSMVTVSPAWRPMDPWAVTVEGLRARVADAWERWERVWSRLSAGGLAGATARLEISAHGHVHVHAIVYGGWVGNAKLREVAGCHVDRRAPGPRPGVPAHRVVEELVAEVCKYALKAPSALRAGWVGGDVARSGVSMHPALAARVTVALHREQTVLHYGSMRDAVQAESASRSEGAADDPMIGQSAARCPCCGASNSLLPPVIRSTAEVARELGPLGWIWRGRAPPRVEVGVIGLLPARVAFYSRLG